MTDSNTPPADISAAFETFVTQALTTLQPAQHAALVTGLKGGTHRLRLTANISLQGGGQLVIASVDGLDKVAELGAVNLGAAPYLIV